MEPTEKHTHLWNDLPQAERNRLMPYMIELQIRHVMQCKTKAIAAHRAHLKALDEQIKKYETQSKRLRKRASVELNIQTLNPAHRHKDHFVV